MTQLATAQYRVARKTLAASLQAPSNPCTASPFTLPESIHASYSGAGFNPNTLRRYSAS